jgi:hypothetical protein
VKLPLKRCSYYNNNVNNMFHFAVEPIRLPSIAVRELGFSISVFIFLWFLVSFKMFSLSSY